MPSQVSQDIFVELFWNQKSYIESKKQHFSFLEIGAGHPRINNNTEVLEARGYWKGVSIDFASTYKNEWEKERKTPLHLENALSVPDWPALLEKYQLPLEVEYLSLDIDEAQLSLVQKFPWEKIIFGIATIEHDAYRFGNEVKQEIRSILLKHGYLLIVADVKNGEVEFEDWWIHPKFIHLIAQNDSFKLPLVSKTGQDAVLALSKYLVTRK